MDADTDADTDTDTDGITYAVHPPQIHILHSEP